MPSLTKYSHHLMKGVSLNLIANFIQGLLTLALIPIATLVLGPQDYAVFGMAVVVVALAVALCETGSAYVLYGHYQVLNESGRARLQSTLLTLALLLGLVAMFLVLLVWPILVRNVPLFTELTQAEMWLLCLTLPLKTVWSILNPILISRGRSDWLAFCLLLQSVVGLLAILSCLYLFEIGRSALFWGHWAGLFVCVITALTFLRRSVLAPFKKHWLKQVHGVAFRAWFVGLAEHTRSLIESALIVKAFSSEALGNYNHAKVYQGLTAQGTNAFANYLWPIALKEARDGESRFIRIRPAWDLVYVGLTCIGFGAVFLGDELVSLLTHGKFLEAGAWLPWLVVYTLLQNAGKPATAILFVARKSNYYSNIRIITVLLAILALLVLIPIFGVEAVLSVGIFEMLIFRVFISVEARRVRPVPFQDQWVVAGCLLIFVCWYLESSLQLSLMDRCSAFMGLSCTIFAIQLLNLPALHKSNWCYKLFGRKRPDSEKKHV